MHINKFVLIPGLVLASGGALFAGSALSVTDTTDAIASVVSVLSISAPATADFGVLTPGTPDIASDFNVTVISNGTADPGAPGRPGRPPPIPQPSHPASTPGTSCLATGSRLMPS